MLFSKQGMPEEGELVLCTVTKVMPHSVFTNLDEYGKSGMIHISEISPGRIRNIRDFVSEGRKIVCKILSIDKEKGHIDLSLRRVNEMQRRGKTDWIKQEQKAEKIVEIEAKKKGMKVEELYNKISDNIFKKYESLNSCFQDIVIGKTSLEKLGIEIKIAEEIEVIVRQRIKPPEVEIKGELVMLSHAPDGVEMIKEAMKKAEEKGINITYAGGGSYKTRVKAPDYKKAEKVMKEGIDATIKYVEKKGGEGSFKREEK